MSYLMVLERNVVQPMFLRLQMFERDLFVVVSLVAFACCSSEEWNKVSKSEREKLGVTVQDDGEFW